MDYQKLGKFLQNRRVCSKISQELLGEAMRISKYTVQNLESGAFAPSFTNVWKYAVILGIKLSEIEDLLQSENDERLRKKARALIERDKLAKREKRIAGRVRASEQGART